MSSRALFSEMFRQRVEYSLCGRKWKVVTDSFERQHVRPRDGAMDSKAVFGNEWVVDA